MLLLAFATSFAFAQTQKIKRESDNEDWWAQKSAAFFPKYQFTLASTNPALQKSAPSAPDVILANQTWVGGGAGDNTGWLRGSNWSGGTIPGSTGTATNTDIATLPATGTNPALGIPSNSTYYLGAVDFTGTG